MEISASGKVMTSEPWRHEAARQNRHSADPSARTARPSVPVLLDPLCDFPSEAGAFSVPERADFLSSVTRDASDDVAWLPPWRRKGAHYLELV